MPILPFVMHFLLFLYAGVSYLHYARAPHVCLMLEEPRQKAWGPLELELVMSSL